MSGKDPLSEDTQSYRFVSVTYLLFHCFIASSTGYTRGCHWTCLGCKDPLSEDTYGVFFFYQKMCTLFQKVKFCVCFLKMFRPLKGVICFILNNLYFRMVEGIAFYALHKSRVLIIPCKADGFCLFIGLPDKIYKKASGFVIQFLS